MYAIIRPNTHAFPHNSPSFAVEIFDDDGNRIGSRAVLEANLPPFTTEQQAISMLGSYTADIEDVHRDGDGFRVENLRPL
ncbi:MAG TPA: hypothetical protein DCR63_03240 [Microbacterium sp.]|nr:hypothetical protein [Microbacterium sp.]